MTTAHDVVTAIRAERLVAIVRSSSADEALCTARHLVRSGVRVVEVSLTTPDGLAAVAQLAAEAPDGVFVGAGTVLGEGTARAAVAAGARFLVSPIVPPDVLAIAAELDVVTIPGAATPTEMTSAVALGADFVKIFPASQWTPKTMADVLEALPQLPFVPTGGVTLDDADSWIAAGAAAVGMAGSLGRADADEIAALRERLAAAR